MKAPREKRDGPTKKGAELREYGRKWLARIDAAGKAEKTWIDDARKAVAAFSNQRQTEMEGDGSISSGGYDFNILFANVETIVPAVINSAPVPDIRRRFQDEDPAARIVSDILERAIRVQIDDSRLQQELEAVAQDAFLAGRGPIRIRFYSDIVPTLPTKDELEDAAEGEDDAENDGFDEGSVGTPGVDQEEDGGDGEDAYPAEDDASAALMGHNGGPPLERLENERIRFEAVSWVDYRHGPAKRWEERPWEAFRFCIPREEEDKSFDTSLIGEQLGDADLDKRRESEDELTGWEIWDKSTRRVVFIDDEGCVLMKVDDPLGLSEFFCSPTPIQPISLNGRLMPINPFAIYRTLAEDLDTAVRRKNKLVSAMKVRGWYGMAQKDLEAVLNLEDDEFSPVNDPEVWAQAGGIDKAIAFWPLEKFIAAIQQLDRAIEQYKQWIYEITGISDIVRGASVASETATAQNIKSQWGSLRIQKMQRLMERCARDLFVMMAEIIPSKFSYETLEEMTGIEILPRPEDEPEKLQEKQAVMDLMKRKLSSYYRIDVESDSTVRADLTRQKQEVSEFLQGASAYFGAVAPLVQQGAMPAEAAVEIFAATARMFNLGKSVEDTLEKMIAQAKAMAQQAEQAKNAPQEPSPEQQAMQAKMQGEQQAMQAQAAAKQQDMEHKAQLHQFDMQARQAEAEARMAEAAKKAELDGAKAQRDAILDGLAIELRTIERDIKTVELKIKETDLAAKVAEPVAETSVLEIAQ